MIFLGHKNNNNKFGPNFVNTLRLVNTNNLMIAARIKNTTDNLYSLKDKFVNLHVKIGIFMVQKLFIKWHTNYKYMSSI